MAARDPIPADVSRFTISAEQARMIAFAQDKKKTPFDYVIVGSGAGGGPLAARLALAGKRVLLIDAGHDPKFAAPDPGFAGSQPGEANQVPGYHAAATEDLEMSWQFSVRHYHDDARQATDEKYNKLAPADKYKDPSPPPAGSGKRGIFYPRSAGLGGCTGHHAMIMVTPNDRDWNAIADLTGDDSWRAENMRGYFARLERCLYPAAYQQFLHKLLGWLFVAWRNLVLLFSPHAVLDDGGHGFEGWQPTSLIDPNLVQSIASEDRGFINLLARTATSVLHGNKLKALLKTVLFQFRFVQALDPNDLNTRRAIGDGGVFLIPLGIAGDNGDPKNGVPPDAAGRRVGVREFLLQTQQAHPEYLVIATGYHVMRVIFSEGDEAPRAIGVEVMKGDHLYEASPLQEKVKDSAKPVPFFTKGEVVLCGGAYNTPQLLMLSGIGDTEHLQQVEKNDKKTDSCTLCDEKGGAIRNQAGQSRIHLPGVGRNLQDRYEVTVVSEVDKDFSTLDKVTFSPGDPNDPARTQWQQTKTGLYTTNGGAIAVMRRSTAAGADDPPDLFIFGAPAAFRGYYWGWSRELLRGTMGATIEQRNLWSWVILKAYTRNNAGTVRLRTTSAFACPDVCFDSFNEAAEKATTQLAQQAAAYTNRGEPLPPALAAKIEDNNRDLARSKQDLVSLMDAVSLMRRINARNQAFVREIQPGGAISDHSTQMEEWVKTQTWGHHASCTCRIGSDKWQADTQGMTDRFAVLDSRFRVHGVERLRVVDASVFPSIPGYFILTPIFIMSEKAADTLLEDSLNEVYPAPFRRQEAQAILDRRQKAGLGRSATADAELPDRTVGLAISGGGIRSATFALGFLQALSKLNRLREIDMLSTVSGGGFAGSFLGRLFTRTVVTESTDPCGRVQEIVANTNSGPIWWLRTQGNYIFATGKSDWKQNLATYLRNVFTVHLVLGALLFGVFGLLRGTAPRLPALLREPPAALKLFDLAPSVWWWLPAAVLALAVVPASLGFWLAPRPGLSRSYPLFTLLAWLVVLFGSVRALGWAGATPLAAGALAVLILTWIWQEIARWGKPKTASDTAERRNEGALVRGRLTRGLGDALLIFAVLLVWVVIDTLAQSIAGLGYSMTIAKIVAVLGPTLPALRSLAGNAVKRIKPGDSNGVSLTAIGNMVGVPLALFLLFFLDLLAHELFLQRPDWAREVVAIALAFSLVIGRAITFLNLSSLSATYAARLTRTFQGASNPDRTAGSTGDLDRDVEEAHPKDDVPWHEYHPERAGGPLHLINVCLNETLDHASGREVRERKGLAMSIGPHGVSVGLRYFAQWAMPAGQSLRQTWQQWLEGTDQADGQQPTALKPIGVSPDPRAFHVLASRNSDTAPVESLSLGTWTAISGAAFNTGLGRGTTLPLAFFMGFVNLRLGHWWDTGIGSSERPGQYPLPLWRKIKSLPSYIFRMQSMLLAEWRGLFPGPGGRFWYLSDGGHFDVTGLYELLRRRLPFMIVTDAGEDDDYRWDDVAQVIREARMDFGARVEWVDRSSSKTAWAALSASPPPWIKTWINPDGIGPLTKITRQGPYHAALARVSYDSNSSVECWILLIKPSLTPNLTQDILNYAANHTKFPQDPTFDQVFDDMQWESYRALGEQIGQTVLR